MGNAINSFFRFLLGFSLFIAVSLGLTVAVTSYTIEKDKQEQTAAAFKAMLNLPQEKAWWEFWK